MRENKVTLYIEFVIKPLEKHRNKLIHTISQKKLLSKKHKFIIIKKYDDLLYEKYKELADIITNE